MLPLGLTTAVLAADAAIHKKILSLETLIISTKEMENIMKIVRFLKESGLLIKNASETIDNESKE